MALSQIQGYVGTDVIATIEGGNLFYLCYNNSGVAFTNGDLVQISALNVNPGESATTNTNSPTIIIPAATSVAVSIGAVSNGKLGLNTIAAGKWGFVQTKGDANVTYATTIVIDDYLIAQDGATTIAPDGLSGSTLYSDKTI